MQEAQVKAKIQTALDEAWLARKILQHKVETLDTKQAKNYSRAVGKIIAYRYALRLLNDEI